MKSRSFVIGLSVLGCLVIGAVIYAQVNTNNSQSIPAVEVNSRFVNADKNGDGVLCKEEFANYFAQTQQVKFAANNSLTGTSKDACCGGADIKTANTKNAEKTCCSEGKNAETVSVKFSKEGEAKAGCCGGKDKTKSADTKNAEKTCCSESKKESSSTTQSEVKTDSETKVAEAVNADANNKP
ncbi:MAG: hypothetical protein LBB88_02065 [Planctomycetaceae bacterium]|jgi:hypothetical protein|nr:hypothetical protein [Planctomycetaceae bacterium]